MRISVYADQEIDEYKPETALMVLFWVLRDAGCKPVITPNGKRLDATTQAGNSIVIEEEE